MPLEKILIVDDDKEHIDIAKEILWLFKPDVHIDSTYSAGEARKLITGKTPYSFYLVDGLKGDWKFVVQHIHRIDPNARITINTNAPDVYRKEVQRMGPDVVDKADIFEYLKELCSGDSAN